MSIFSTPAFSPDKPGGGGGSRPLPKGAKMTNTTLYPPPATEPDEYDICEAFAAEQKAAPLDRILVFRWISRYPHFSEGLIDADRAWSETLWLLSHPD